tara:strand:+ start:608 stop:1171 length:564 start_codon:yes stop_codon:yes gene_type:complete
MSTKNFKPIMVAFDEKAYNKAQQQATDKLQLLDNASVWIHNQIPIEKKIGLKRLHLNMLEYFRDAIVDVYKDVNQLGLSADKLIEAKEIPIAELIAIQDEYEKIKVTVEVKQNIPRVEVKRKDYETWTTSEKQNRKIVAGNFFIKAIKGLDGHCQVYPFHIQNATSNFIRYDAHENKWVVNAQEIFS